MYIYTYTLRQLPHIPVQIWSHLHAYIRNDYTHTKSHWLIHQLWQSDFSRVYSNYCCNCTFEPEIIKIGQSSHKMYNNNILNFQESTTILNPCTKKSGNLLNSPRKFFFLLISNMLIFCQDLVICLYPKVTEFYSFHFLRQILDCAVPFVSMFKF